MKHQKRNHQCGFVLLFALVCHFYGFSQTGLVQIGTGNSSIDQFPILSSYDENYAQIIYTASELQASGMQAGTLTKIKFRTQNAVSTQGWDVWDIYMGHTTQSAYAADDAWVPFVSLSHVYNGSLPATTTAENYMEITLSTPFVWNGTSNIVIAIHENTADPAYTPAKFYTYSVTSSVSNSRAMRVSDSDFPLDLTNPSANDNDNYYSSSSNRYMSSPQVQFEAQVGSCLPILNLQGLMVGEQSASISWTDQGSASEWIVEYGPQGFSPGQGSSQGLEVVTGNPQVLLSNLTSNTTYAVFVRANCGANGTSAW